MTAKDPLPQTDAKGQISPRATSARLHPTIAQMRLILEQEAVILQYSPTYLLPLWHAHGSPHWNSARLFPPTIEGPYLLLYFAGGVLTHPQQGWSYHRKGWSPMLPFSKILEIDKGKSTIMQFPYELEYLYWKGLTRQS